MRTRLLDIDSQALGAPVLDLLDVDPARDFAAFERDFLQSHAPAYVSAKIPLENLAVLHHLEACGFQMVECQFGTRIHLGKSYDPGPVPYGFEPVTTEARLAEVADIAATSIVHDRYNRDPAVPPHFGPERYRLYVRQAFVLPDQEVFRMFDPATGETLGVRTQRRINDREITFLLGAIRKDLIDSGLGLVLGYLHFNWLIERGVRVGHTAFSSINYPVFNIDARLGFRIVSASAVVRKVYPRIQECFH